METRMKITSRAKSWLRTLRLAGGIARFDPRGSLPELLGNVAQTLRGALFCFRRNFLLHKTLHARELFLHSPAKIFEVLDAFEPRKLFVDALAELFEFVHKRQISRSEERRVGKECRYRWWQDD